MIAAKIDFGSFKSLERFEVLWNPTLNPSPQGEGDFTIDSVQLLFALARLITSNATSKMECANPSGCVHGFPDPAV